ncbi:type II secretion system F family protein [Alcaligenaceae bacterium CGII-47]|nr:type II secretion system F family protein [Alcaligenaceae bacterium CGII-47]
MNTADLVALIAFFALLLLGLLLMAIQGVLRQRPAGRVHRRLNAITEHTRNPARQEALADLTRAEREARQRLRRQAMGWLGRALSRTETVAGRRGVYLLMGGTIMLFIMSSFTAWLLPLPWFVQILTAISIPALGAVAIYQHLNEKFRRTFLEQLPDILDMIIRASQAGIPVTQSIRNVGEEFAWPGGPEFQRIGDSLYLGNDMTTVFDEAEARIQLPDFSFLSVCLLLQRETGGSLAETLSNLAAVVRARRDLRLKSRALTAEGRMSGTVIAAIPPLILGLMLWTNPEYISVLFDTESGRKLLMVAAAMLLIGILLMRKIAKLGV